MSGMISELVNIMDKQLLCFEYLLGLSDEKREAVIENDIDGLKKITELENRLIHENSNLEKQRLSVVEDIGFVLNEKVNNLTVSRIIYLIKGQPGHDELLLITEKIKEKIELLKESNARNKMLINNSLDYIDYTMNIIRTTFETEPASFDNNDYLSESSFFDTKQ